MNIDIKLHNVDLPEQINFSDKIAIDCEFMGLNFERDKLCLVQISSGKNDAHIIKLDRNNYNAPNLKKLLINKNINKIFHFARADLTFLKKYLEIDIENVNCTKIMSKIARSYSDKHGLKDLIKEFVGIDISKQSLDFAKKFIQSKNLELVLGNNLDIPLKDNFSDLVISDGVIHHTGDTVKAFNECIRILKPGGFLYLAIYKRYRYYPYVYKYLGSLLRLLNKTKIGSILMENTFVYLHFILYKLFKKQNLSLKETRNIFYDYFITPIASFHSKSEVKSWINKANCRLTKYDRTSGNCHVFIIEKS